MRATGLENSMVCGRKTRSRREVVIEDFRVFRPDAFSMMPL